MTTKSYRKFTKAERRAVKKAVKAYSAEGGRDREGLAKYLNDNNVTHPNKPAWTVATVGSFLANNGINLRGKKNHTQRISGPSASIPKKDDRLEVAGLLLVSELPDLVKMKALRVLLDR